MYMHTIIYVCVFIQTKTVKAQAVAEQEEGQEQRYGVERQSEINNSEPYTIINEFSVRRVASTMRSYTSNPVFQYSFR